MKLRNEIDIDAPCEAVFDSVASGERRPSWQPRVQAVQPVSGDAVSIGHVRRIVASDGSSDTLESVSEMRKPDFLATMVESPRLDALIVDSFEHIGDRRTRWTRWSNATFRGLNKLTSLFSAGGLREQMEDDMHRLKLLIESEAQGLRP